MDVAVVGAGVVGTLTAYYLRELGCRVTIYERAAGPAKAISRANGGQLSYSFCDAMADPQLIPKLPGILCGLDPAFRVRASLRLGFIRWGLQFLSQCRVRQRDENTKALLRLAIRSAELMRPLNERFGEQAAYGRVGKLVLLDQAINAETERRIRIKTDEGLDVRLLNQEQIWAIEPALKALAEPPITAIYSPTDEVANAYAFTLCLARFLQGAGVVIWYGESVESLRPSRNRPCVVETSKRKADHEAIVLATGDAAVSLLRPHGIRLPILAMSGYSWTFPAIATSPTTSITALSKRIVYSRLGDTVRVAGFADLNAKAGRCAERAATLRSVAAQLLPEGAAYDRPLGGPWHGMRAMTPTSRPILGHTALPGVYTNLGHGMLGWTLGAATSELVAQQVTAV